MNEAQPNKSSHQEEKMPPKVKVEDVPVSGLRNNTEAFAENDEDDLHLRRQAKKAREAQEFLDAVEGQDINPELNQRDVVISIKRAKEKRDAAKVELERLQKEVAIKRGYTKS